MKNTCPLQPWDKLHSKRTKYTAKTYHQDAKRKYGKSSLFTDINSWKVNPAGQDSNNIYIYWVLIKYPHISAK